MNSLTWCPKCGRDLEQYDYDLGYCSMCGEPLAAPTADTSEELAEASVPDAAAAASSAQGATSIFAPETLEWQIDGEWAVCPRCGASYELADRPLYCERCVPDPDEAQFVYTYPQASAPGELVLTHRQSGARTRCTQGTTTVLGRTRTAGLDGKMYVGRRHAQIIFRDGEYYIQDLDSVNGTTVNGKPLSAGEEVRLTAGDVIALDVEQFAVDL